MANAKKLPSGAWRVNACKTINGKKVYKSFTVHPRECRDDSRKAKSLCESKAKEWQLSKKKELARGLTVKGAVESFLEDRSRVYKPSTISGYKKILKAFAPIWDMPIEDIDNDFLQKMANDWGDVYKTKTIKNRMTLLLEVLQKKGVDRSQFDIDYPKAKRINKSKVVTAPDLPVVKDLIDNAPDTLRAIIYLAAFGGLRRGEIAGLRGCDISKDMCSITINGDLTYDEDNNLVYNDLAKTDESIRTIFLPKFILDALPTSENPNDYIFGLTPNAITDRFRRLAQKLGYNCTLHSLRHYAASFRSDLMIPRKYIEEVGGWKKGSQVLQKYYDNTLDTSRIEFTKVANTYIEETFNNSKLG